MGADPRHLLLAQLGQDLGWDAAGLWVLDASGQRLRHEAAWAAPGVDTAPLTAAHRRIRFGAGQGLPGRVWQSGRPAWVEDVAADDNFTRAPAMAAAGLRSAAAFPVAAGRLVGVIELFSRDHRRPDDGLLSAMAEVGRQLGPVLDRRQVEAELRLERERQELALAAAALGLWDWDAASDTASWSATTAEILALPPSPGTSEKVTSRVYPDDLAGVVAAVLESLETGADYLLEHRVVLPDGSVRWVEGRGRPLRDDSGEVTGITGVVADVTDRRLATERQAQRQAAGQALTEAVTSEAVIDVVVEQLVASLGGQAGVVALVTPDDELEIVGSVGYDDELLARWQHLPLATTEIPITHAIRSGQLVAIQSVEEFHQHYQHLPLLRPGARSLAAVPLLAEGRALGAIGIVFAEERRLTLADRDFMVNLAGQCAMALERARLYEAEREARARLAFLTEAGDALVASLDVDTTLATVARLAVPRLADWCGINLALEGGQGGVRRFGVHHVDPAKRALARRFWEGTPFDPDQPRGAAAVLRTGRPELTPVITDELLAASNDPETLAVLRELGVCSSMVVPMSARGRTLGAITLVAGPSGRHFGDEDLALARELARRAGLAVDNARLFSERSHVARALQESLLPRVLPAIPGVELGGRYLAAGEGNEVGGDFYDVFAVGDGTWAVLVGDVCGRGPEAAGVTALARYTARAIAPHVDRPSQALARLNRAILDQLPSPERFFTAAFASLRTGDGGARLVVSCAGHPPPLLVRADGTTRAVGADGTLLGLFDEVELSDEELELGPGDAVVFYTDGVIEARRVDAFFGEDRLRRVVADAATAGAGADGLAGAVADAVTGFRWGGGEDDVAVLVARVPS
jgi:serine phosphatase RsbU (regulator of sigma subunit)/PAS domain-containing protein